MQNHVNRIDSLSFCFVNFGLHLRFALIFFSLTLNLTLKYRVDYKFDVFFFHCRSSNFPFWTFFFETKPIILLFRFIFRCASIELKTENLVAEHPQMTHWFRCCHCRRRSVFVVARSVAHFLLVCRLKLVTTNMWTWHNDFTVINRSISKAVCICVCTFFVCVSVQCLLYSQCHEIHKQSRKNQKRLFCVPQNKKLLKKRKME